MRDMTMGDAPAKRRRVESDPVKLAVRMHDRGMDTVDIAAVLGVSIAEVAAWLAEWHRERQTVDVCSGVSGSFNSESDSAKIAGRLLADPGEFVCPILHSLIDNPVVADDGHTYEKAAIEEALQLRSRSPMTNACMSKILIPNLAMASQLRAYKEGVLSEVMRVAPGLTERHAASVLQRALEIVRAQQPPSDARNKLVSLLRMRLRLAKSFGKADEPHWRFDSTVAELVEMLMSGDSPSAEEVLDMFDEWKVEAVLPKLEADVLSRLFQVANEQARTPRILSAVGSVLARALAPHVQTDKSTWQRLWNVVRAFLVLEGQAPKEWADRAAVVLAAAHTLRSVDLASVQKPLLERTVALSRNLPEFEEKVEKLFGVAAARTLGLQEPAMARVVLELASRRTTSDDDAGQALSPNGVARVRLAARLSSGLFAGSAADKAVLCALVLGQGADGQQRGPHEILAKLRLPVSVLQRLAASALTALEQHLKGPYAGCSVSKAVDHLTSWLDEGANSDNARSGFLVSSLPAEAPQAGSSGDANDGLSPALELRESDAAVTCLCFGWERRHRAYVLLAAALKSGIAVVYKVYRTERELEMFDDGDPGRNETSPEAGAVGHSGAEVHCRLQGHTRPITHITFTKREDHLITASMDKSVRMWCVSGNLLKVFTDSSAVLAAAQLPRDESSLVVASAHAMLRVVGLDNGRSLNRLKFEAAVTAITFDDTGLFLLAGTQVGSVSVLEAREASSVALKLRGILGRHCVSCLTFVPAPRGGWPYLLANLADSSVAIIDCVYAAPDNLSRLVPRERVPVPSASLPIRSCGYACGQRGYMISGSENKDVVVFCFAGGTGSGSSSGDGTSGDLTLLRHHAAPVVAVAVNLQRSMLISGDALGHVVLWRRSGS